MDGQPSTTFVEHKHVLQKISSFRILNAPKGSKSLVLQLNQNLKNGARKSRREEGIGNS